MNLICLLAALALLLARLIGAMRAGIVVAIDRVDLGMRGERRVHFALRVRLQPLAVRVEDDLDVRALDALHEPVVPILGGRRGHQALQLDDIALAAKQLHHVLAGLAPDLDVVAADEAGVLVAFDLAVQHDDRDAGVHRLRDRLGERARTPSG